MLQLPITALATAKCHAFDVILSGRGSVLRASISNNDDIEVESVVFEGQAIHGIVTVRHCLEGSHHQWDLVVFGGRQLAWATLMLGCQDNGTRALCLTMVDRSFCNDWLLCGQPRLGTPYEAVFLTSYNALYSVTADPVTHKLEMILRTDELSTFLYSADLRIDDDGLIIVASGTAFGEVFVWLFDHGRALPWREFRGHYGSIFNTSISDKFEWNGTEHCLVASCSDDRTIHIWDISDISRQDVQEVSVPIVSNDISRAFPKYEQSVAMTWAHLSRIWSVDFARGGLGSYKKSPHRLVSTGEDGQAIQWSLAVGRVFEQERRTPQPLESRIVDRHHAGKNIWSHCFGRVGTRLLTGGADGQVISRIHNEHGQPGSACRTVSQAFKTIKLIKLNMTHPAQPIRMKTALKAYLIVDAAHFLATTDAGLLLSGRLGHEEVTWQVVADDNGPASIRISSTTWEGWAFFLKPSRNTLYALDSNTKAHELVQVQSKKVAAVSIAGQASSVDNDSLCCVAVSYFGSPTLDCIWIKNVSGNLQHLKTTSVILPETFEATSVYYHNHTEVLLCGSRAGAIAVYVDVNQDTITLKPFLCRRHLHSEDTITSINGLGRHGKDSERGEPFFVTTGRDGTYSALRLTLNKGLAKVSVVHQATTPLGPNIEGCTILSQDDGSHRLLLHGFRSKDFVVWDETNQTQVMAVDCGGAHRSWTFKLHDERGDAASFIWTKAGTFMLHEQRQANHKIIQTGGHGREVKALAVHHLGSAKWLVATGSEDTDIRLSEYSRRKEGAAKLRNVAVIRKHTTGLQDLHFSPDRRTLFSAAGMEEMYAWRLSPVPVLHQGVVFAGALPRADTQSDARIMSFDLKSTSKDANNETLVIVAAFSNGQAKVIEYEPPTAGTPATFTVLRTFDHGTMCLTQASFRPDFDSQQVLSVPTTLIGATDGHLSFVSPSQIQDSHKMHQNSIQALSVTSLTPKHNLIVSGGDDNALAFTVALVDRNPITATNTNAQGTCKTLLIPHAHATAITAIAIIDNSPRTPPLPHNSHESSIERLKTVSVISAGNDQYVQIWSVIVNLAKLESISDYTNTSTALNTLHIDLRKEIYTNVADISKIAVLQDLDEVEKGDEDGQRAEQEGSEGKTMMDSAQAKVQVMVVGVGIEVLSLW